MGNKVGYHKIGFETMQACISHNTLIINTLESNKQDCLIVGTISYQEEEESVNSLLGGDKKENIVLYGMNCLDESVIKKAEQLLELGFSNIFIYVGGLFEWVLLQDIYGEENFPTIGNELELLKFRPSHTISLMER